MLHVQFVLDALLVSVYNKIKKKRKGDSNPDSFHRLHTNFERGKRTMDNFELDFMANNMVDSALTLKALANAFFRQFVEGKEKENLLAVSMNYEDFQYLYGSIMLSVEEVAQRAKGFKAYVKEGATDDHERTSKNP